MGDHQRRFAPYQAGNQVVEMKSLLMEDKNQHSTYIFNTMAMQRATVSAAMVLT